MSELIGIRPFDFELATNVPGFKNGTIGAYDDPVDGYKEFIYGSAVGTQTVGQVCVEGPLSSVGISAWSPITTTNTAPGALGGHGSRVGVATAAATIGQFCWYQVLGRVSALTAGAVVLGTRLNTTATAGGIDDDGSVGARVINGAVFKTAVAGAQVGADCRLFYPTVGVTL